MCIRDSIRTNRQARNRIAVRYLKNHLSLTTDVPTRRSKAVEIVKRNANLVHLEDIEPRASH